MLRNLVSIAHGIRALLRPRLELAIENTALRQQLALLKQKRPRPSLTNSDRIFWMTVRRFWTRWTGAVPRLIEQCPSPSARVAALPRVGGIHHRYVWREQGAKAA